MLAGQTEDHLESQCG